MPHIFTNLQIKYKVLPIPIYHHHKENLMINNHVRCGGGFFRHNISEPERDTAQERRCQVTGWRFEFPLRSGGGVASRGHVRRCAHIPSGKTRATWQLLLQ